MVKTANKALMSAQMLEQRALMAETKTIVILEHLAMTKQRVNMEQTETMVLKGLMDKLVKTLLSEPLDKSVDSADGELSSSSSTATLIASASAFSL